jgi:hypothetical protein
MTNFQFTIALMVFLIAYALFEVPSNYMLKRLKPSNWIAFLMLSWGAITMGLGGVQNFGAVTAVRFLLGVFEAGLFPGLVCECFFFRLRARIVDFARWLEADRIPDYLTFWYRSEERSIRVALILASATLAGAFGGKKVSLPPASPIARALTLFLLLKAPSLTASAT